MGLMEFLARFKVGTRVYAGFLTVLALMVVVAVIGSSGLSSSADVFSSYASITENAIRVSHIDRQVAGLRRNVYIFNATGDTKALARIAEIKADLTELLPAAINATHNDVRKEKLKRMLDLTTVYFADVDKAKLLGEKRAQLSTDIIAAGSKAHADLVEIIAKAKAARDFEGAMLAGAALDDLMTARLNVSKYLRVSEDKSAEQTRQSLSNLDKVSTDALLTHLTDPKQRALAQEANSEGQKYAAIFEDVVKTAKESEKLVGTNMAAAAEEFAALASEVGKSQHADLSRMDEEGHANVKATQTFGTVMSVGAVALGLFLAWLIARGLVHPITTMTDTMTRLAAGDRSVTIPALGQKDEIGDMAKAVQVFKDNADKVDRMAREEEEAKKRAEKDRRAAMLQLADGFESQVKGVVESVSSQATELQATAGSLSAVSEQASRQAVAVASAAEEASSNVQTVASAAEELSASIQEISRQVARSATMSQDAVDEAHRTNAIVISLADAAGKIGAVVNLITDIASQTNLLALNATIEAARAGDAGKGFAVVAGEVKNLANQTARATDEISQQINGIQAATKDAVQAIGGITRSISDINQVATTIASAVEEQGAATQEIARNVQQASAGTQDVSMNIGGVQSAASETGHGAEQVLEAARDLSKQTEALTYQVDTFISNIRAG